MKVVRLYTEHSLQPGQRVTIPPEEWHYYSRVRRRQGEVRLFNRQGQQAKGHLDQQDFVVEEVEEVSQKIFPLVLALGLPESSVLKQVIPSLSEMGVEELRLFEAERSQAASKRLGNMEKWEKMAIESARQCGRARPLQIKQQSWKEGDFDYKFFMDEVADEGVISLKAMKTLHNERMLLVVGPEGGWTSAEREEAERLSFQRLHFPLPVMTVGTAALCASFYGILTFLLK